MQTLTSLSTTTSSYWQDKLAPYKQPELVRSLWQAANTIVPYFALWGLMLACLDFSYWLVLLLALPAGGLLIRIFIISHDCGHGSFFRSRTANSVLGSIASFLCYTPYYRWRREHAIHHASSGDLDRRGVGDVWTLTVREYFALPRFRRLQYRLYRNPLVMFIPGSLYLFLIHYRVPAGGCRGRERSSVWRTNLALLALWSLMGATIGIKAYVLIQLPIFLVALPVGVWLFYVQHQFEGTYWERNDNWDYVRQAMEGSSYYRLPKVLQWFTGNIGFHHVHHLSASIPNYYLPKCHRQHPVFQEAFELTLASSLKCLSYRLWDEDQRRMVSLRSARRTLPPPAESPN